LWQCFMLSLSSYRIHYLVVLVSINNSKIGHVSTGITDGSQFGR